MSSPDGPIPVRDHPFDQHKLIMQNVPVDVGTLPTETPMKDAPFDPYFGKNPEYAAELARQHGEQPTDPTQKATNPKDAIGSKKHFFSTVPWTVIRELGVAMLEGCKYGRHNYRVAGARASVYFDATMRHLTDWWEFRDNDPESAANIHEITKAIASLTVLRDAMICGKFMDDRPPASPAEHKGYVQSMTTSLLETLKFKQPYVRGDVELR